MMFVIQNTETRKLVARPGSQRSYTSAPQNMWVFRTRESAERQRCVENEIVIDLHALLSGMIVEE